MATKEVLLKWKRIFCGLSKFPVSEQAEEALLSSYNAAFAGVSDKAFEYACETYQRDGKQFPPRPAELQELIPRTNDYRESAEDYRIREAVRCQKCGKVGQCIQEPAFGGSLQCRECYTGMTKAQFQKNMNTLSRADGKRGVYAVYNSNAKTVSLTSSDPGPVNETDDIFGEE